MDNLAAITAQVSTVFIVDNGSSTQTLNWIASLVDDSSHVLIVNRTNLGIAEALNQGVAAAVRANYKWAVLLDQDSVATTDMVKELTSSLRNYTGHHSIAVVGPNMQRIGLPDHEERWLRPKPHLPLLFERARVGSFDRDDVTMVITSGSLINLEICQRLGMFWSDLFIDYVDTEYCLRAKRAGFYILVSHRATLLHRLGDKQIRRVLGVEHSPTFHSATRHYYMARNRIHVMKRHAVRFPHWAFFDILAGIYNFLRVVAFEDGKGPKVRAIMKGTLHGVLGRLGPIDAHQS